VSDEIRVFAPATVANLGPGFDVLGLALAEPGDIVTARRGVFRGVRIAEIRGDGGALPRSADANTAGIAAGEVLRRSGADVGIELELDKGLPLGSGLGSSGASAAAAAHAANLLLGEPLGENDLVGCCVEAESAVSGRHADNVAPALLGGLILVRTLDPLDLVRLPLMHGLTVVVVTPKLEVPTREAREVLPKQVGLGRMVSHAANLSAMVSALHSGDLSLLERSMIDEIVTPARAALIPGGNEVMAAARDSGAAGSSISGAGPSIFALCASRPTASDVEGAMTEAFERAGLESSAVVSPADCPGARRL
jgi:homoserine kinase